VVGGKEKGAVKKKNSHGFPFPCRQGRLKGDNWVSKIYRILDFLALNVGRAKDR
jgi:hypothetical protein